MLNCKFVRRGYKLNGLSRNCKKNNKLVIKASCKKFHFSKVSENSSASPKSQNLSFQWGANVGSCTGCGVGKGFTQFQPILEDFRTPGEVSAQFLA